MERKTTERLDAEIPSFGTVNSPLNSARIFQFSFKLIFLGGACTMNN